MGPCHQQTCKHAGGSKGQQNTVAVFLNSRWHVFSAFGNVGSVYACVSKSVLKTYDQQVVLRTHRHPIHARSNCCPLLDHCELSDQMYRSFLQHPLREANNIALYTNKERGGRTSQKNIRQCGDWLRFFEMVRAND